MNLGAAAFWIFVAAIIIASMWKNKHTEAMRHETLRLLIEKNQKLDEAQLAEILKPSRSIPPEYIWGPMPKPGDWYKGLRVFGTIAIFLALGLAIVGAWRCVLFGMHDKSVADLGAGIAIVAMVGVGLFVASRFLSKPPSA